MELKQGCTRHWEYRRHRGNIPGKMKKKVKGEEIRTRTVDGIWEGGNQDSGSV